jgi:hypothetical protein
MEEDFAAGRVAPARRVFAILGTERAGVQAGLLPSSHALAVAGRFVK